MSEHEHVLVDGDEGVFFLYKKGAGNQNILEVVDFLFGDETISWRLLKWVYIFYMFMNGRLFQGLAFSPPNRRPFCLFFSKL